MIVKSSRFINFVKLFLFGNKKENRWYLIFSKKGHKSLLNSCNLNKSNVQRVAISQEIKLLHSLTLHRQNFQDKTLFQN